MKFLKNLRFSYKFIFLMAFGGQNSFANIPKLSVVIVIDQFAAHYKVLRPYFKHGFLKLFNEGIVFENAKFPHAMPATAPGHTTLSTGTLPKYHGIVGNYWYDQKGNVRIKSDEDSAQNAAVFAPNGFYDYGKSSKNLCVDGLSDQLLIANPKKFEVYSISLKSRAAIGMANRAGRAIWFDEAIGKFTTSKAFYNAFPSWLAAFNKKLNLKPVANLRWKLSYPLKSKEYDFINILNDTYTKFSISVSKNNNIETKSRKISGPSKMDSEYKFGGFCLTPTANEIVLDLALECVRTHLSKDNSKNMVLWVSLSSLDKVGHEFGPQSILTIDMIYKLDEQIGNFMKEIAKIVHADETLYVLSADHGCMQIPELLAKQKIDAHRLNIKPYIAKINQKIEAKFNIPSFLKAFKSPQIFIDESSFRKIAKDKAKQIEELVKHEIRKIPCIKNVWTPKDLSSTHFSKDSFEVLFKNQFYRARSGHFNLLTYPYCLIDDNATGTGHRTPYNYDTNVPLVFYRQNHLGGKFIYDNVSMVQVAPTLASILKIQKPSASIGEVLPGIFPE